MTDFFGTSKLPPPGGPPCRSVVRDAIENSERAPLRAYESSLSEAGVNRVWNKIQAGSPLRPGIWGGRGFALVLWSASACALLLTVFVWLRQPRPLAFSSDRDIPIGEAVSASQTKRTLRFDDGSQILLQEQGEISILSNEGTSFVTALRVGKAKFSVTPGGPRRWVVDAGELSVEVVGTVFTVERTIHGAKVTVERGKVLVTDRTTGKKVYLVAGGTLEAKSEPQISKQVSLLETKHDSKQDVGAPDVSPDPNSVSPPREVASVSLEDLERDEERAQEAVQEIAAVDAPQKAPRVAGADLLKKADEAKKTGDLAEAGALYLRVVRNGAAGDPRRGIAAMSYARLSSDPKLTAEVLESALPTMPNGLRESAWLRLVRAHLGAGDSAAAKRSAQKYLAEFPEGKRREEVIDLVALE